MAEDHSSDVAGSIDTTPRDGTQSRLDPVVPAAVLLPWILITCCFALWGFANDITIRW